MKRAFLISIVLMLAVLLAAPVASAQRNRRFSRYCPWIYDGLNLTEEQIRQRDAMDLELDKALDPLFAKLNSQYLELDNLERQRNPDRAQIDKAWDRIEDLEREIADKEDASYENFEKILTPEQRARYGEMGSYPYAGRGGGRGYFRGGMGRGAAWGAGRGVGRLGRGQPGYGRGSIGRGMGRSGGRGYYAPRWDRSAAGARGYAYSRYGRGPCGAGMGRWDRRGYGRGWPRRW